MRAPIATASIHPAADQFRAPHFIPNNDMARLDLWNKPLEGFLPFLLTNRMIDRHLENHRSRLTSSSRIIYTAKIIKVKIRTVSGDNFSSLIKAFKKKMLHVKGDRKSTRLNSSHSQI